MGLADFFFPKKCAGCSKNGTYFCVNCIKKASLFFPEICPVCKKPSLDGLTHKKCQSKLTPEGLTVIWEYSGAPANLIKKIKYKFVSSAALSAAASGAGILKNLKNTLPDAPNWQKEKFTLIPVPLYWGRHNWRGFNHVEEIGKFLCQSMGWEMQGLLVRKKYTQPQVGLDKKKRLQNLQSAFILNPSVPVSQYSNVLLLDDVWTTGTTMLEAAKVLKQAGFKKVWCLALCG